MTEYRALRGGNYREGGARAEVGETYTDVPDGVVEDLIQRRAIELVSGTPPSTDYEDRSLDDLQSEANAQGLVVEGTGSGGRVLKSDLARALTEASGQDRQALGETHEEVHGHGTASPGGEE